MAKGAQDYATGTYILLAAGALMTIIGFLGCCGALRESQCLLGTVRFSSSQALLRGEKERPRRVLTKSIVVLILFSSSSF